MYANSRFKKIVDEWGQVKEWIMPGDSISQDDLNVSDAEWDELKSTGAVVDDYPDGLRDSPQTPPAEYYRKNPKEAAPIDVDESTPSTEAMAKTELARSSGQQLPTGSSGEGNNEGEKKAPWEN